VQSFLTGGNVEVLPKQGRIKYCNNDLVIISMLILFQLVLHQLRKLTISLWPVRNLPNTSSKELENMVSPVQAGL